jgi:hypothetical protein
VSQSTALRSEKAWLRAIERTPSKSPAIAAPTVPEKTVSTPRLAPRLIPESSRSGGTGITCRYPTKTESAGVPLTLKR